MKPHDAFLRSAQQQIVFNFLESIWGSFTALDDNEYVFRKNSFQSHQRVDSETVFFSIYQKVPKTSNVRVLTAWLSLYISNVKFCVMNYAYGAYDYHADFLQIRGREDPRGVADSTPRRGSIEQISIMSHCTLLNYRFYSHWLED